MMTMHKEALLAWLLLAALAGFEGACCLGSQDSPKICITPHNTTGKCINIKSCGEIYQLLYRKDEPGVLEHLISVSCGTDGQHPKVCCPLLPKEDECGVRKETISNKIINGQTAGEWPWMVALGYRQANEASNEHQSPDWRCGGSLVTDQFVLTAAHCVTNLKGDIELYIARLGDMNLVDRVEDGASPVDIEVEKVFPHEGYTTGSNDIALVKLAKLVNFTSMEHLRPICVPTQKTFNNLHSLSAVVAGWGRTANGGQMSVVLQDAQVNIMEQATCVRKYKDVQGATVNDKVICANKPLRNGGAIDVCEGDSGGPLMKPTYNNTYYVIGVVSLGYHCGQAEVPGLYTKVSAYTNWIKTTLAMN